MNKTILITGSSSRIGKATARFFQEKGWNVIATMRIPIIPKKMLLRQIRQMQEVKA
jgi:NAD(P)-dependent dehydrogenase (short-subunit alcohol dehydrogenase family)